MVSVSNRVIKASSIFDTEIRTVPFCAWHFPASIRATGFVPRGLPGTSNLFSYGSYHLVAALLVAITAQWQGSSLPAASADTKSAQEQLCDPMADFYLGMEDYPETIKRHIAVIQRHPDNAVAHYHLGFAYGMTGQRDDELKQYQQAVSLGLSDWELFLNLGLLHLENKRIQAASDVLRLATLVGPERPETHFNLGLAYEEQREFAKAEQEILLSLQLNPDQPDAHNNLGVIYAELGNYGRAREEWGELLAELPTYVPAKANLAILNRVEKSRTKSTRQGGSFIRAH